MENLSQGAFMCLALYLRALTGIKDVKTPLLNGKIETESLSNLSQVTYLIHGRFKPKSVSEKNYLNNCNLSQCNKYLGKNNYLKFAPRRRK